MRTLILARHAESVANRDGIVCADPVALTELTEEGRRQAESLGKEIAQCKIELCVTSQLRRAIATADLALAGLSVPRLVVAEFNDPLVGHFEGKAVHQFNDWLLRGGPNARPPEGESQHDAMRRYVRGYEAILQRPEETILAVIHRLPILWLLGSVESTTTLLDIEYAPALRLDEHSVSQAVAGLRRNPIQSIPY